MFRLPWISVIFPFLLFVCVTPLATFRPWLLWLYVIPLLALVYVLVTNTVADTTSIATRGLIGRRRVEWDDLDGFEFQGPRWALAVTQAGDRFRLPMVRPRDLPVLAQVSGGRLTLGAPAPAGAGRAEDADSPDTADSDVDDHEVADNAVIGGDVTGRDVTGGELVEPTASTEPVDSSARPAHSEP